jgi:hypothetical protein
MLVLRALAVLAADHQSAATFILVIAFVCILRMCDTDSDVLNAILVLGSATATQIQYLAWDRAKLK